ncbi:hypothetical protein F4805DRAFT_293840 [Annulohypoxylon moriforme]|nr:hypothetical protein F4805DRAFT_293840 [Annulohypoxylon moriforme]
MSIFFLLFPLFRLTETFSDGVVCGNDLYHDLTFTICHYLWSNTYLHLLFSHFSAGHRHSTHAMLYAMLLRIYDLFNGLFDECMTWNYVDRCHAQAPKSGSMDHVFYDVERSYGFHANTYAVTYKSIEYMNGIRYPIDPNGLEPLDELLDGWI